MSDDLDPDREVGAMPARGLRALTPGDLDAMHRLAARAVPHPWTRAQLAAELRRPRGQALGLDVGSDRALVGYVLFWVVADEMEVVDLLVAPDCRRQGLGRALLQGALDRARAQGARRVFLEVRAGNTAAQELYQRVGFVEVGRRPGYYVADGQDARVLQLDLIAGS